MSPTFIALIAIVLSLEVGAWLSDQQLHGIAQIPNTNLFTGIAYQLIHPTKPNLNLAWIKQSEDFQFTCHNTSDESSLFYLVPGTASGYYFLRNAITGVNNLGIKCQQFDGDESCISTIQDSTYEGQMTANYYQFIPKWNTNSLQLSQADYNIYTLVHFQDRNATYWFGTCSLTEVKFQFVPLINFQYNLVGLNATSNPYNVTDEYLPKGKKIVWRETVRNPTAITREKEVKLEVTESTTTTLSTDETEDHFWTYVLTTVDTEPAKGPVQHIIVETPLPGAPDLRKTYVKLNQMAKKKEHVIQVTETFIIPDHTCVDILLVTEVANTTVQNVTAYIGISGKTTRFTIEKGIRMENMWIPGLVTYFAKRETSIGKSYFETRSNDVVYEISGNLTTNFGIHTVFSVREVNCLTKTG